MTLRRPILTPSTRSATGAIIATVASLALVFAAGVPAASAAAPAEKLTLSWTGGHVLTLPSTDSFNDSITLHVKSTRGTVATETMKQLSGGGGKVLLSEKSIPLSEVSTNDWEGSLAIPSTALNAGVWSSVVKLNGVTKSIHFSVGSGIAKSATVTADRKTYFTNSTVAPYQIDATLGVKDETGTYLPIKGGHLQFTDPRHHVTVFTINASTAPTERSFGNLVGVNGLHTGTASLKAIGMVGPGSARTASSKVTHVALALAALKSVSITPTYTTMYTNLNGYHSTENFTFRSRVNTPNEIGMTGQITLKKGSHTVMTWPLTSTGDDTVTWNGKDMNDVFPGVGTYTLSVRGTIAGSNTKKATTHFVVSDAHWKKKSVSLTRTASDFFPLVMSAGTGAGCTYQKHHGRACVVQDVAGYYAHVIGGDSASGGGFSTPAAALKYAAYAGYTAKFELFTAHLSAPDPTHATFQWGAGGAFTHKTTLSTTGETTEGPESFTSTDTKIGSEVDLLPAVSVTLKSVTVKFTYSVLP